MKYARPAVTAGAAAGLLTLLGNIAYPSFVYPEVCNQGLCTAVSGWVPMVSGALGILLAFDSAICLVGPRKAFYGVTAVSLLIAVLLVMVEAVRGANGPFFWTTLALTMSATVLSFLAARTKTAMSEQSNPMNLPVFG